MKTQTLPKNDNHSLAHTDTSNSVGTQLHEVKEKAEYPLYTYLYDTDTHKIVEIIFESHPYPTTLDISRSAFAVTHEDEHKKIFRNSRYIYLMSDFEKREPWQVFTMMPLDKVHHFTDEQYVEYFDSCGGGEAFEELVELPKPHIRWHLVSHLVCIYNPSLIDLSQLDLSLVYKQNPKLGGMSAMQIKNHFLKRFI